MYDVNSGGYTSQDEINVFSMPIRQKSKYDSGNSNGEKENVRKDVEKECAHESKDRRKSQKKSPDVYCQGTQIYYDGWKLVSNY